MKIVYPVVIFVLCMHGVVHGAGSKEEIQKNVNTLITQNQCSGCNLSGADLNRLDLSGADLSGADLSGATFFLADLSGANLKNSILRGVQFGGADLAGADLSGADMRGAVLNGAYLTGAIMDGGFENRPVTDDSELQDIQEKVYISDQKKPKEVIENQEVEIKQEKESIVNKPEPVVQSSDASTIQSAPEAPPVKKAVPVQSVTIDTKNTDSKDRPIEKEETVEQAEALNTEEKRTSDTDTITAKADSSEGEKQTGPQTAENNIVAVQEEREASSQKSQTEMMLEKLREENKCYKCSFAGAELEEVDLEEADLEGTDFTGARLEGADFEGANLKGAIFRNADIRNANFKDADLYKADFTDSDVTGADFKGAETDEAIFNGASGYQLNLMTGAE